MKPGNVTICPLSTKPNDPKRTKLYLIDFGISSEMEDSVPTDLECHVAANPYFVSALTQEYFSELVSYSYVNARVE